MRETLSAVLWDMDGVIVDSGDLHYKAWSTILTNHNIPFDRNTFNETFGMNNMGFLKLLLGTQFTHPLSKTIGDEKEKLYRALLPGRIELLPGVKSLLIELQAANILQAVASSAPPENIDVILDTLNLRSFFRATISAAHMPGKPDPSVFLSAAQALNTPPRNCIVIEDAIAGVQAAKNAGMLCVAVLTTNPEEKLQDADLIVNDLKEISLIKLEQLITQGTNNEI